MKNKLSCTFQGQVCQHFIDMKKIFCFIFVALMIIGMCSCDVPDGGISYAEPDSSVEEPVKISYIAEFYDNHGGQWLSVEGTSFSIEPNKVKEYAYKSDAK